jgi:hypothetical protein
MAKNHSRRAERLPPGTPCLVRSEECPEHTGKLVVVEDYDRRLGAYDCCPELTASDGSVIAWDRSALIPLGDGDGIDEMLLRVGMPSPAQPGEAVTGQETTEERA